MKEIIKESGKLTWKVLKLIILAVGLAIFIIKGVF